MVQHTSKAIQPVSLLLSRSSTTTEANETGTWRFMRPKYAEKTAPCSAACPAGQDIPRIEMFVARGMFAEAAQALFQENPFPAVCGRVCFHPCEAVCNRRHFDEGVGIRSIERRIGDTAMNGGGPALSSERPPNGRRIAIVGAGPAGLSTAWFLTRLGYSCRVFEREDESGGLLRWGIPSYRLPENILRGEIERLAHAGVSFELNHPVSIEEFKGFETAYHGIFVGCGQGRSLGLGIPGEAAGLDGLEILDRIRKDDPVAVTGDVAVIGGGNTAIDVSRSLIRRGARPFIIYRRRREDMPAFGEEVEMAFEEGIVIRELLAPVRIEAAGRKKAVVLQPMAVVGSGPDGRARVVPDGDRTETLVVNDVVLAIGAEAEARWQQPGKLREGEIDLGHCRLTTTPIPVVSGGDLTNTNRSVADAIASGKAAAIAFDTFFQRGPGEIEATISACRVGGEASPLSMEVYLEGERRSREAHIVQYEELNIDYFEKTAQGRPLRTAAGPLDFSEIEATLTPEAATAEASRCFNCGVCNSCDNCRVFCPEPAVSVDDSGRRIDLFYCKGCGICVTECPRNAMDLEEENS